MIIPTLASLLEPENIITMDCGFKYTPYIPKKRISSTITAKGSFTQKSIPLFNHGKGYVDWDISSTTAPIARIMYDLYNLDDTFTFTGAYGEEYLVEFSEIQANPAGGPWAIKGKFRVLCVFSDFEPDFQCPVEE